MSYLHMNGQVLRVFQKPESERDGQKFGGTHHVQLLCENPLSNGEVKVELFTLRTDHPDVFRPLMGREVSVPVGAFVSGKELVFFLPKGRQGEVSELVSRAG